MADVIPRQHKISSMDRVTAWNWMAFRHLDLYEPLMLSLPSNDAIKSLLTSLSTRLTNRYLVVTRVIQCSDDPDSSTIPYLCDFAKPFVWYRNESAGSTSGEPGSDNQLS